MNRLPVVILAGGLSSRLPNNPHLLPKVMVPVNNRPLLYWKLKSLSKQGVTEVYLLLGAGAEIVVKYLNENYFPNLKIASILDGPNLLGTGGALRDAIEFLPKRFILTFGDNLLTEPIANFSEADDLKMKNIMVVTQYVGPADKKNILLEQDHIIGYLKSEENYGTHTDYGYSILNSEVIAQLPSYEKFDLTLLWQKLISKKELFYYETSSEYREIGTPETLRKTEIWLTSNINLFE